MPLSTGSRLGAHEILGLLGVGGMGEVYRARDLRLGRDVALKILPDTVGHDADRLARFQREARVLATLNHPNIGSIYGLEETDNRHALVLELVEGPTLAERIDTGPIPFDEALPIAIQIATALEAAHEQGVVHRDLKPANIKVRPDGTVKVLDFGLAKLADPAGGTQTARADAMQSPTMTSPALMTGMGVILGTATYMSPEQAKGRQADKRSDVWAFGCVLYEMLTAKRAFAGDDVSDTLANVLKSTPDWTALPSDVPPAIVALLKRSMEKDPARRIGHMSAILFVLGDPMLGATPGHAPAVASVQPARRGSSVPWTVSAVLLLAALVSGFVTIRHLRETPPRAVPFEFIIPPPDKSSFGAPTLSAGSGTATQVSISPDGEHVVFVASRSAAEYVLWLRSLRSNNLRVIEGTEGATFPFWSPDSRTIAFFAGGKLKKVQLAGGPSVLLCDAAQGRGGTWNTQNVILFAPDVSGVLQRVSSAGGVPQPVGSLDEAYGEVNHRFPWFLPDGDHFLYTSITGAASLASKPSRIKVGSMSSSDTTLLTEMESSAEYGSGRLLFIRNGTLMAQPFDPVARTATSDPVPIAERISTEGSRYAGFAVSSAGTLVYAHGEGTFGTRLTWYDRSGKILAQVGDQAIYSSLSLSPDERQVAVTKASGTGLNVRDVWTIDLERNLATRATLRVGDESFPVWSADGSRIAFSSLQGNERNISAIAVGRTGADEALVTSSGTGTVANPTDWSRDGAFLAYTTSAFGGTSDIWIMPTRGDRKPFAFAAAPFTESQAVFSPDSHWVAYTSFESGQAQIFVQPFPPTGVKKQISRDGGYQPMWRGDGNELFFLGREAAMMAVSVTATASQIEAGLPQQLFPTTIPNTINPRQYGVTKDGKRFLINALGQQAIATPLTVVVNWPATLEQ